MPDLKTKIEALEKQLFTEGATLKSPIYFVTHQFGIPPKDFNPTNADVRGCTTRELIIELLEELKKKRFTKDELDELIDIVQYYKESFHGAGTKIQDKLKKNKK